MRRGALIAAACLIALQLGCREKDAPTPPQLKPVDADPAPMPQAVPLPLQTEKSIRVEVPAMMPERLPATPSSPGIPRDALRYQRDLIGNARAVWGINAWISTFAGQVHQESTWKADARSRTGAAGLAQFMPRTSDWISGLYRDELGENQPLNPAWALRALVRYDKHLYDRVSRFETACDRIRFALADYNGGSGWRIKRQNASPRPGSFEDTSVINPGIAAANQRENEEYPRRIVFRWQPLYVKAGWGIGACD